MKDYISQDAMGPRAKWEGNKVCGRDLGEWAGRGAAGRCGSEEALEMWSIQLGVSVASSFPFGLQL